ncbi:MAG: DUF4124 domain-containing protein [Halioglobus sp.]
MINNFLLILFLLVCSVTSQAEKLYKILDEEGNVSFSQFPPVVKKENVTVENITVGASPQTTVTDGLEGAKCGNIKLLNRESSKSASTSYMKSLDQRRSSWRKQLDLLNQSLDTHNQRSINNSQHNNRNNQAVQSKRYESLVASTSEKLKDLRCALAWADKEFSATPEYLSNLKSERTRLENIKGELQVKLDASCGEIPAYDPSDKRNEVKRKRWYDCSKYLRREIDTVDREIGKT